MFRLYNMFAIKLRVDGYHVVQDRAYKWLSRAVWTNVFFLERKYFSPFFANIS